MNKLEVGIVGCGLVAHRRHIPAFLRLKDQVSISALCDQNRNQVTKAAENFGIEETYTDFSRMITHAKPDLVDICTPPHTHAQLAIEAMENGCHVLVEKPMALESRHCERMIKASRRYGTKLSVVHNQRFYPPFLQAQELVERGSLGELTGVRILSLTPKTDYIVHQNHWIHKLPGGAIWETGPHTVYMSLAFLGEVNGIRAKGRKTLDLPWILCDNYEVELEGKNVDSTIIISHAGDYRVSEVDLVCEEAMIRVNLHSMLLTFISHKTLEPVKLTLSELGVAGQIVKGLISNVSFASPGKTYLGHDIIVERFIESIASDKPVPVPASEGLETVRVVEVIAGQVEKGRV